MEMGNNQWVDIAPVVAKHFWGEPKRETSREIRWGNKGSKCLTLDTGHWYDFEADRGGGVLELLEIELQIDRKGAIQWMREMGYLQESSPGRNRNRSKARSGMKHGAGVERKRAPAQPKPNNEKSDKQTFALKLWRESEKIGESEGHPFRRWGKERNLLHPFCECPPSIRWSGYRGGVIIAGVFPLDAWGNDGTPKGDPVAVQAMAIDSCGKNRYVLGEERNLRRCSYGPVSAGVFLVGCPQSERVNIVEGIADALAVYSREQGAVVATLGTATKLRNEPDVIEWLCEKNVYLFPDDDENKAGDKGAQALIASIKEKSPDASVKIPSVRVTEDPGEWGRNDPFPVIEKYDFSEKSGIFFENGLPWAEADRMAIQTLTGRFKNERK